MAVRFKLDENLPRDAEEILRRAGHDIETVLGERLGGSTDERIFDVCRAERRILVTLDLDLADVRLYPPERHEGIWVLRPVTQSIANTLDLLRGALEVLGSEQVEGRLWIVEPGRVRIRE